MQKLLSAPLGTPVGRKVLVLLRIGQEIRFLPYGGFLMWRYCLGGNSPSFPPKPPLKWKSRQFMYLDWQLFHHWKTDPQGLQECCKSLGRFKHFLLPRCKLKTTRCAQSVLFCSKRKQRCKNQDTNIDILLPHLCRTIFKVLLLSSLANWLKSKIYSCVALVFLLGVRASRLNLLGNITQWKIGHLSLFLCFLSNQETNMTCTVCNLLQTKLL